MKHRLKQLFVLSIIASAGLLCLQAYWIRQEWSRSADILQRQVNYSFQRALEQEWNRRKDSLTSYLNVFLHDTSFVGVGTKYNKRENKWMITMYDPANPSDYASWTYFDMVVGEKLTAKEKEQIIDKFIKDNVRKSVKTDVIFYYTQRFGKVWAAKQQNLGIDSILLQQYFQKELRDNAIETGFAISFRDTTLQKRRPLNSHYVYSEELPVNFATLNDYDKKYKALARVDSPGLVLLQRIWLVVLSSVILSALTLYCLYRMYRTILRQKQLDELKDDFISNMTHELKTPIATVSAAIDGLQYYDALDDRERTQRYLNTSRNELKRLDELVSKVLSLSGEERWNGNLKRESFQLKEFFEELVSSFSVQPLFSWKISIDPSQNIYGDREKLASAFQNIIENSIKYANGATIVTISAKEEQGDLLITISDNGPGIDAAHLPFVFNKFYRAPSVASGVKGFGLGLYYVAGIVAAHGGSIRADNQNGLIFFIQLPLKH